MGYLQANRSALFSPIIRPRNFAKRQCKLQRLRPLPVNVIDLIRVRSGYQAVRSLLDARLAGQ